MQIPPTGNVSITGGTGAGSYTDVKNLGGGARNVWNKGDSFVITNGYPARDQIGRTSGTEQVDGFTVQKSEPLYEWNNMLDGRPVHFKPRSAHVKSYLQEGRDYINKDKTELGYKPYVYPHPLATDETFPPKY